MSLYKQALYYIFAPVCSWCSARLCEALHAARYMAVLGDR
jgi:protein-disulfide isomerase-like protein with CxxC motif